MGRGRGLGSGVVVLALVLLALSPAGAAPVAAPDQPTMEGRCGPEDLPPDDPGRLLADRASHVPPLDLCAAWIEPIWDDGGGGVQRLVGLAVAVEVAGDLEERPPLSWFRVQGTYDRGNGEECNLAVNYYDRPPRFWDPYNAELLWSCDRVEDRVAGFGLSTEFEWTDLEPTDVKVEGSILELRIHFDELEPWARLIGDDLAAAGALHATRVSSGVHGHLPYRNPPPVLLDQMSGGTLAIQPAG